MEVAWPLKMPFVVVKTGEPVAAPLVVALIVLLVAVAPAPPAAAQEAFVMPFIVNERDVAPLPVILVELDSGAPTVVLTPLRVYATKTPEEPEPNPPEILKPVPAVGL